MNVQMQAFPRIILFVILFSPMPLSIHGDERLDTLRFGIDSEVLSLIDTLAEEKEDSYHEDLLEIYGDTINDSLKTRIVAFFDELDTDLGVEPFFKELQEKWDQEMDESLLLAVVDYLSSRQNKAISRFFARELLSSRDNEIFIAAVNALGKSGDASYTRELAEELERPDISVNTRSALISAMGKLGDRDSIDTIKELLVDEGEEKSVRWRAASALGEIGGAESLRALISVLDDPDPVLRSRIIEALGSFDDSEAEQVLIQALRDSFWRVRVSAATALGEMQSTAGVDILIYKAEHDPDSRNVRMAAIDALGEIGSGRSMEFLEDHYLNEKSPLATRSRALSVLLEKAPARGEGAIGKIFQAEQPGKAAPIVKETARILSLQKKENLEGLYRSMLESGEKELILEALQGIRINTIHSLEGTIEQLLETTSDRFIRTSAEALLKQFAATGEKAKEEEKDGTDE